MSEEGEENEEIIDAPSEDNTSEPEEPKQCSYTDCEQSANLAKQCPCAFKNH